MGHCLILPLFGPRFTGSTPFYDGHKTFNFQVGVNRIGLLPVCSFESQGGNLTFYLY